eukprot:1025185-Pyramimonas_sp.AAC.1
MRHIEGTMQSPSNRPSIHCAVHLERGGATPKVWQISRENVREPHLMRLNVALFPPWQAQR